MTAFTRFLGEKAERYIELRHSLGYSFSKQAGTLRDFVRYVECAQFDAPATRSMALDFVLSSVAPPTAAPLVTACSADSTSISPSMTPKRRPWSVESFPDPGRFRRRGSSASQSWRRSSRHVRAFRQASHSRGGRWQR